MLRAARRSGLGLALLLATGASAAGNPAPRNRFLADSSYPIGHGTTAGQDAVPIAGPAGAGHVLKPDEIAYAAVGPAHFGASTSGPYPDGRRVLWSNGLDRIVKLDHETFEILATRDLPNVEHFGLDRAESSIRRLDARTHGARAIANAVREAQKLRNLASVYTLIDADGVYYVGDKNGTITAYADAVPGDPASDIVPVRSFRIPEGITGQVVGINLTHDGWLVVATEHGTVLAVSRDFREYRSVRLRLSDGDESTAAGRAGDGWIRNGFAVDADGGIYIASRNHVHKVIWTGARLSVDPADGAWTARYPNSGGHGTGSTPSLMGFGEEDRFVVITDGQELMHVTLLWRDEVPDDWEGLPSAPDRRIAGSLPADMGDPTLAKVQSEQSVVVAGYGALVVNNMARNIPWYVPDEARPLLSGYLGIDPEYQPRGVQKFRWNPVARRLEEAWGNASLSSPNCLPIVSTKDERVYLIGAREGRWTLEAVDWETGRSVAHWAIGGQRYNSLYSGTLLDERGRIHYGTVWGRVRLDPHVDSGAD